MTAWFDARASLATAVQLDLPLPMPLPMPLSMPEARSPAVPVPDVRNTRRMRGKTAYLSGLAAEDSVLRLYVAGGMHVLEQRWRGSRAEIDLILKDGDVIVFVEVKKSRSFDAARLSLGPAQRRRIAQAATEYLGHAGLGQLTDIRFDLAMVNGIGAVEILENAFGEDE
jgi:putative endonuclease